MTDNYTNQNIEHTDKLEILLNKEIWDHMAIKEIGIEEGRAQGIAQGIEQGIAQGIEQGIAQGIEQGRLDNQKEMIKTMYNKGVSKDEIHNLTDFSLELIEETLMSEN